MNPSILLVQPDPAQARRLQQLIHDLGHDSQTVADGETALVRLRKDKGISLIVLELSLPGMDGVKLMASLRELVPGPELSLLVITAYPELRPAALRLREELGIAAVESSKSTAMTLHAILKDVLGKIPARFSAPPPPKADETPRSAKAAAVAQAPTAKPRVLPPPSRLSPAAGLSAPADLFKQLAKQKDAKRLARIAALHLDQDLPQDEALQKLVRDTAQAFEYPVALISLVLQERRLFNAHLGPRPSAHRGSLRDWASCAHLMEVDASGVHSIADVRKHAAFREHPLVHIEQLVSYSAASIITESGQVLGSLCLVDQKPHALSEADADLLRALARRVSGEIALSQHLQHLSADRRKQSGLAVEREAQLEMLKHVLESLHLGILLHDKNRKIVLANSRLCELTGLDKERIESGDAERFLLDMLELFADPDSSAHRLRVLEEGPYVANEVFELRLPHRSFLRWTARPVHVGDTWYQLSTWEDLTAEIDLEAHRESLATQDPLTELLNRRGGEEEGLREAERARRKKHSFCVLRLHMEGLKAINATQGYAQGDFALQVLGACLRQCLRLVDRPARWSGRQFMVILPETDELGARLVAKRICEAVAKLDVGAPLTLHAGVAHSGREPDFKACLAKAENRLAKALKEAPGTIA